MGAEMTYPTIGATVPGPGDLGELTLDRVLGAGAFGIVSAATAQRTGAIVAVKFLQAGVLSTPHERQALFNEVLAAREFRHEHVLRVLFANLDSTDYPLYIVSEFADGGRLHEHGKPAHEIKTEELVVDADEDENLFAGLRGDCDGHCRGTFYRDAHDDVTALWESWLAASKLTRFEASTRSFGSTQFIEHLQEA